MDLASTIWGRPLEPLLGMAPLRPSYPRLKAASCHRPTSWFSHGLARQQEALPDGGIRAYSDDRLKPGRLLEMDVFPTGAEELTMLVQVEWCDAIPGGEPARFDVGLRIVQVDPAARARLARVLGRD